MSVEVDFVLWEAQLSEPPVSMRLPESETYGRSTSTPRRLGAFAIGRAWVEVICSPEAAQARAEFDTSVKEGFGTDMELGGGLQVRDFDTALVIDGRVMAKDNKTPVSSMTEAGLRCAIETAKTDKWFSPQLTRSVWDHENALIVDKMARGETSYNTRIVVSPFPEEAAVRTGGNAYWRKIGYVPHLKRGFVQLYHVTKDGQLVTGSLSFDGCNKHKLREMFGRFGVQIPKAEITDNWLNYAITSTVSEDEAKATATGIADTAENPIFKNIQGKNTNTVDVTNQHESIMERVFNESYVHICESLARKYQTEEARKLIYQLADNAHNFNEHYAAALRGMRTNKNGFTDDDWAVLHELLVYSTIEMMRALHIKTIEFDGQPAHRGGDGASILSSHLQSVEASMFQSMLSGFGAEGAKNNRTYSACGLSISLGGDSTKNNPQSAFGGHDKNPDDDEDDLGSRWFTCPKKHLNYRRVPNIKEKTCTTCGTDISCEPPRLVKPKTSVAPTWEKAFDVKPKEVEGFRPGIGKRALVGAGKS